MRPSGLSNKLTETCIVDEYFIEFNGCEVRKNDVQDFEVLWGSDCVKAVLTIIDTTGTISGDTQGSAPLTVGGMVNVHFVSGKTCEFDYDFYVEKINHIQDTNNKRLLTINLIDKETLNLKGTFVNKGYPETTYSDAIEKHLNDNGVTNIKVVRGANEPKVNTVIPAHRNALDVITSDIKAKGMELVRTMSGGYLVSKECKTFDKLTSTNEEFEYDVANHLSFWRILQYNIQGLDMDALLQTIPVKQTFMSSVSQIEDTEGTDSKAEVNNSKDTSTIGKNSITDLVNYRGEKLKSSETKNTKEYFNKIAGVQKASIWVPGLSIDRIGKKVTVHFPTPPSINTSDYDEILSGEWEVYMVRDKIIKEFFVQELFIRRAGQN